MFGKTLGSAALESRALLRVGAPCCAKERSAAPAEHPGRL